MQLDPSGSGRFHANRPSIIAPWFKRTAPGYTRFFIYNSFTWHTQHACPVWLSSSFFAVSANRSPDFSFSWQALGNALSQLFMICIYQRNV